MAVYKTVMSTSFFLYFVVLQSNVDVSWDGWFDDDAGIIRFDFNIHYLAVLDHHTGFLEPKYMLHEVAVNYTQVKQFAC